MKTLRFVGVIWPLAFGQPVAARDFFELPPINYSMTASDDEVARLAREIERGEWDGEGRSGKDFLREILKKLEVPEESQVMVFSKTSLQNSLINQRNPRAIYFSMDTYVGWVPGEKVEVIAVDEKLGPVFYTIDPPVGKMPPRVVRATDSCLQCHATSRTSGVPGMFIRSVVPDENSHPVLSAGTFLVTDQTPLKNRWGGWYASGSSDEPHLGNRWIPEGASGRGVMKPEQSSHEDLSLLIDTEKYLQPTSDIVALMVLEHQCQTHNLLTKAKMTYERAVYFQKSYSEEKLDSPEGMAWKTADSNARAIASAFLFSDEVDPGGDGVEGSEKFTEMFEKCGVESSGGSSLREFRLYGRIFRYRCSYMIHSKSFKGLPAVVRERVFHYLREALDEESGSHLGKRERKVIRSILEETVPGFKTKS